MERGRLKNRISHLFRESLRSSCRISSRNVMTAVQEPVFVSRRCEDDSQKLDRSLSLLPSSRDRLLHHHQGLMEAPPRLSVDCGGCRPTTTRSTTATRVASAKQSKKKERRVSEIGAFYETGGHGEGRKCPPASPVSPSYHRFKHMREEMEREEMRKITSSTKKKKEKEKEKVMKKKKKKLLSNSYGFTSSSSVDTDDDGDLFSSDEGGGGFPREGRLLKEREGESETLFSSRSFSSDSSELYYHSSHHNNRKKTSRRRQQQKPRRRRDGGRIRFYYWNDGFRPLLSVPFSSSSSSSSATRIIEEQEDQVLLGEDRREGFAVVKQSSDPYADFRNSMVEMIVEKQMFGAKDLEHLLCCYLSLNSPCQHRIILEVFSEIRETLFGN